jgi:hypothetical protein
MQFLQIPSPTNFMAERSSVSTPTNYPVRESPLNNEHIKVKNTFISIRTEELPSPSRHTIACLKEFGSYSPASVSSESTVATALDQQTDKPDWMHACGPAKGNHLHESGKCRPCVFLTRKIGCANGADCEYCHCYHSKKFLKEKKRLNKIRSEAKGFKNMKWDEGCYVNIDAGY